jgi:hypothetical protein
MILITGATGTNGIEIVKLQARQSRVTATTAQVEKETSHVRRIRASTPVIFVVRKLGANSHAIGAQESARSRATGKGN